MTEPEVFVIEHPEVEAYRAWRQWVDDLPVRIQTAMVLHQIERINALYGPKTRRA